MLLKLKISCIETERFIYKSAIVVSIMSTTFKMENLVQVPISWVDLKRFEDSESFNHNQIDWSISYAEYSNKVIKPWINRIQQIYGDITELLEFENLGKEHYKRVQPDGVVDLTCGFYISVIRKSQIGFIPISVPISYLTTTVNILPYLMQVQEKHSDIPLSDIVETENNARITETGILLPPGEQIMIYTVEKINMPKCYIGQATTKSGIGRRGLDTVATAGTFNKGWRGVPLLELNNRNLSESILVEPGVPIAQFYLIDASHSKGQYVGKFQDQMPKS